MQTSQWTGTLVQLLSLALRLESEGQYDIAKLTRAQADAISRRAAWELNLPNDKETLASDIERIAAALDDADLQAAFEQRNALQCGFCTPGMIAAAQELLKRGGMPSRDAIREHLSGNYCRCTGYHAIVDAVESVAQERNKARAGAKR